jgi:hypothetical protein
VNLSPTVQSFDAQERKAHSFVTQAGYLPIST